MRVLVVEDERKISAYVRRGLEEAGYAVDVAFTGTEALAWIDKADYDAIVLHQVQGAPPYQGNGTIG